MTVEQRLEALEAENRRLAERVNVAEAGQRLLEQRLLGGEELSPLRRMQIGDLAHEIHRNGWPARNRAKKTAARAEKLRG